MQLYQDMAGLIKNTADMNLIMAFKKLVTVHNICNSMHCKNKGLLFPPPPPFWMFDIIRV